MGPDSLFRCDCLQWNVVLYSIGADGVATTTIATGLITSTNDTRTVVTNQNNRFRKKKVINMWH